MGSDQDWRRQRLAALAQKVGGNAALGRKLGYRDGAFVGQMLKGLRPITEKTVESAEAIRDEALGPHGARGWFDTNNLHMARDSVEEYHVDAPPPPPMSEDMLQLLRDLDDIPPKKRSALLDHIHQIAEEAREAAEHHKARETDRSAAARRSVGRSTASVTWGDGNRRQGSLALLVPSEDPFTAAPGERERGLYEKFEKAPKAKD